MRMELALQEGKVELIVLQIFIIIIIMLQNFIEDIKVEELHWLIIV